MKNAINLALILLQAALSQTVPSSTHMIPGKQWTVEDIFGTDKFRGPSWQTISWRPRSGGITYYDKPEGRVTPAVFRIDTETGLTSPLIDPETVPVLQAPETEYRFTLPNYIWAPDGESLLLPASDDLYWIHLKSKKTRRLTDDKEPERDPLISPDGKHVAYLKKGNLCVLDVNSLHEARLTDHGTDTRLIGRFDWVYEEEFGMRRGFFWSPDSRAIAFYELDIAGEPVYTLTGENNGHQELRPYRYPTAGDPNARVRIGVVQLDSRKITWLNTGHKSDDYIARITWAPDSRTLAVQRLNRAQNRLDLIFADAKTGKSRPVLTETDPSGWVDVLGEPVFLDSEDRFLWLSERDNWAHIYLYHQDRLLSQITRGNWEVTELVHADAKDPWIYFMATEQGPLERHLYRIRQDGTDMERVTRTPGMHEIDMSPDGRMFMDTFSNSTTPPRITLHRADGSLMHILSAGNLPALQEYRLTRPEFTQMVTSDGLKLNAMFMKPVDFDPGKKYPVLIYTYSGPGSQIVADSWRRGQGNLWNQLLCQKGFCIFSVDNRGTGFRGNDFKNMLYLDMSRALQDLVEAADQLRQLDYVDPDRVGIWGWSGGGWMTCLAMTKGAPNFRCGIAVAPVTDLRYYDSIWTERYMGLPADNQQGYDASSPLFHSGLYRGGLLLIHGTEDDNVHVENTLALIHALQNQGKPFELMLYPHKDHGIGGRKTRVHLYRLMTDFIETHLGRP
ncbi:S9 family peptidase [bacterium]|nr:S9 family peptidase [bacterium]